MIFTSKMGSAKAGGGEPVACVRESVVVTHRTPHTHNTKGKRSRFNSRQGRARAKTATQLSGMPVRIDRARYAAIFVLALLYPCALAFAGPGSFHRGTALDAVTIHVGGH
ncbi:MAG: hypothetical protein ACRECF_03675 [Methyloceanibacter sp.]